MTGGELEIMSPSRAHEGIAELLAILIETWSLELDVGIAPCGMMTISRADLDLGFEPDKCYYVQHEPQMRDEEEIDFTVDPPPDLAIEVEISHKLSQKMKLYAAFGVPELWHCRGRELKVYELAAGGNYVLRDASLCFPNLPIPKIEEIVRQLGAARRTTLLRSFRDWIRDNVQHGG
jgi:Uma2 family endonuclease